MRARDILKGFDNSAKFYVPQINNAKTYVAKVRLTAMTNDADEWAVVMEQFGYFNRAGIDDSRFVNEIFVIGSTPVKSRLIEGKKPKSYQDIASTHIVYPVSSHRNYPLFAAGMMPDDVPAEEVLLFVLNGVPYAMPRSELKAGSRRKNTTIVNQGLRKVEGKTVIDASVFARAVAAYVGDVVFLADPQLRSVGGTNLEIFLRVCSWEHPDIGDGEMPSDSVTFRSLADALASGDVSKFSPGRAPNSHWKNWDDDKI